MGGYIGARSGTISATVANVQDVTATDTTPEVTIVNNTHEDTDGGREGKVIFKGQQSGGEESTLAEIQASHDGTADDEKGDLIFRTNDGSDGASPTEAMRITSDQQLGIGTATPLRSLHVSGAGDTGLMLQTTNAVDDKEIWEIQAGADASNHANLIMRTRVNAGTGGLEAIRINNNGVVTKPNQPAFSAFRDSSTVEGLNGTIVFNGTRSNIGSHYNTSTGKFTAPVAGLYQFNFVGFGSNSTGSVVPSATAPFVTLYNETTSSNLVRSYSYITSSSSHPILNFSGMVPLAANNVVRIDVGGAYVYSDASDVYLTFSGFLVG